MLSWYTTLGLPRAGAGLHEKKKKKKKKRSDYESGSQEGGHDNEVIVPFPVYPLDSLSLESDIETSRSKQMGTGHFTPVG